MGERGALYDRGILGLGVKAVEVVEFSIVKIIVAVVGALVAILFFPVYAVAGATLTISKLRGRPNRFAAPGFPIIDYPRFSPLLGNSQSQWYLGIVWILQWDSIVEVFMILQILPLLMVPMQAIFSNFLEEVMSWIFGKYDFETNMNEPSMPNLLSIEFPFFMLFELPARIGRSVVLLGRWIGFMISGNASLYNDNHALVNYIQGIDFTLDNNIMMQFPTERAMSKTNAVVLAKSAMLSYERFRVVKDVVNNKKTWHGAKYLDAWEFDDVCLIKDGKRLRKVDSDISATLVQAGRALVLAFRGTEPLKNSNWAVDLNTEPPPPGEVWPYGVYHMGFRVALGLDSKLAGDPTCKMRYLQLGERGDYQRVPGPRLDDLVENSPFELIKARIEKLLEGTEELKLYVTGHSLGAALANIFSAALVVPPKGSGKHTGEWWEGRFGALYDFGQPRLGNYSYSSLLENVLSKNRMDRKFMRIVNTDDIVCRVPPPQVTPPPWYTDAPFWQHPGYTVFLPAVHAEYKADEQDVASHTNGLPPSNGAAEEVEPFRRATHKRVPTKEQLRSRNRSYLYNPFARNRNPSVVHLCEQPPIYRGSSFWHAVKKAIWATVDYFKGGVGEKTSTLTWNPPPSGLRVLTLWLLIVIVLPLGLVLLPTPLFPLGILLIAVSLLEGGLPQGVSDHALDGYLRALVASSESDWDLQHNGTQ